MMKTAKMTIGSMVTGMLVLLAPLASGAAAQESIFLNASGFLSVSVTLNSEPEAEKAGVGEFNLSVNRTAGDAYIGGIASSSEYTVEIFADGQLSEGSLTTSRGFVRLRSPTAETNWIGDQEAVFLGSVIIDGENATLEGTFETTGEAEVFSGSGSFSVAINPTVN